MGITLGLTLMPLPCQFVFGGLDSLQWRHNERDSISNHQRLHCLLNCWFGRRSKKTPKALSLQHLVINNHRFSSQINPPVWAIYSLKSIHSHSILLHTDIYRLGVSLYYSATSSITGKSVRHLEWVRNSCYCIEVLPRVNLNIFNYPNYRQISDIRRTKCPRAMLKLHLSDQLIHCLLKCTLY